MTPDPSAPTLPAVRLRWVDPSADERARLFVPGRTPLPGPVVLTPARMQAACRTIASWPGYTATPLVRLDDLAGRLDLGAVWLKDETKRFGVDSFKALGAGYALARILSDLLRGSLGREVPVSDLLCGLHRARTDSLTAVAATDGNHGRALAWASRMFGCRCIVFVPPQVSAGRRAAITDLGAEVVEVAGTYDEAVEAAAASARRNGWIEVSDTAHGGDDEVPLLVMEGYTALVWEIAAARPAPPPFTHAAMPRACSGPRLPIFTQGDRSPICLCRLRQATLHVELNRKLPKRRSTSCSQGHCFMPPPPWPCRPAVRPRRRRSRCGIRSRSRPI
jgi:diaminopropionate ammonia-lyase